MLSDFQIAEQWSGKLRRIEFSPPRPMLPSATQVFLHYAGLPKSFDVATDQQIRFDFLSTATNLASVWEKQLKEVSFPVGWGRYWQIGDITYTQASAWLCIEELTGRIVAVDVEIDNPVYAVNSSAKTMIACMKIVRDVGGSEGAFLTRALALKDALSADPETSHDSREFWLPLVESAIESGCETLAVSWE